MRPKVIKSVLKKKFNSFLNSIDDPKVKALVKEGTIITGGCITSMLLNEKVNDFDIYFTHKKIVLAVAEYYCKKFNESSKTHKAIAYDCARTYDKEYKEELEKKFGVKSKPSELYGSDPDRVRIIVQSVGNAGESPEAEEEELRLMETLELAGDIAFEKAEEEVGKGYNPVFITSNAITLSDKIQIVTRFYGEPSEIHDNYDFEHCKCYWTSRDNDLVLPPEAVLCTLNKELRYTGSKYPVCSVFRTRKFIKRGWNINAGQYLKMCFQISALNLTDIETLEDQLVGVDTAYFMQIIKALREKVESDSSFRPSSEYVMSIVDKIF